MTSSDQAVKTKGEIAQSIMNKNWQLSNYESAYVSQIQQLTNFPEIIARIAASRVSDPYLIEDFINPKIKNLLPDPYHLLDMQKAIDRILLTINNGEKVVIFGDYDVDGATSSALLKQFFDHIGINSSVYIPDRLTDGYGPSIKKFQEFMGDGNKLVITLDCGTLAFDAINHASGIGLDVIVIDHHKSSNDLPSALAIINPNRYDEKSEYTYLAACAVGFLFLVALSSELKVKKPEIDLPNLLNYLDLVALGTVCDVMPLIGLNRAFVKQGLKIIKNRTNLGLKTLIDMSTTNIIPSTYLLGFVVGPRINAGGRVGLSNLGSRLLSTKSEQEATVIAKELMAYNEERKQIEKFVLDEAFLLAESISDPVIILAGENWHQGVIGIIASRLKDKYHKPTIIISLNGNIGKASSRSVAGFDLGSAVIRAKDLGILIEGGGHAMAAGFSVNVEKLADLQNYMNKLYLEKVSIINDLNLSLYHGELLTKAVNEELLEYIAMLEPYGMGNEEPRFLLRDCFISRINEFGKSHLSFGIDNSAGNYVRAKLFGAMENNLGKEIFSRPKTPFNFIGRVVKNDFYLTRKMEFIIEDII